MLKIPEDHRAGLAKIARLSDADTAALISAIAHSPVLRPAEKLVPRIKDQTALSESDLELIIETLLALHAVRASNEIPAATFTRDVCNAMQVGAENGAVLSGEECETLQRRISVLMGLDSLATSSKAAELQFEHERVFDRARILSDIRTVFGESVGDVKGAVITHELKISYVHGSEVEELYLALDEQDLSELKQTIDRALGKTRTLEKILDKAGVNNLDAHRD